MDELRIVRVPLPGVLIRRMDQLILGGAGGFGTRAEFIREAVEAMVLETTYAEAPEEPVSPRSQVRDSLASASTASEKSPEVAAVPSTGRPPSLEDTRLRRPSPGYVMANGLAEVSDGPMFGLHNRDYPSIWAASRIAAFTTDGSAEIGALFGKVVNDAWQYAKRLAVLEKSLNRKKLTALFPTNEAKPQSAACAFLDFAVGRYDARPQKGNSEPRLTAEGPLFSWGVLQIQKQNGSLMAGVTELGYSMLDALDGLSLDLPHSEEAGKWFCDHLRRVSPGDWWGFATLLNACLEGATRAELTAAYCSSHPEWEPKKAGNYLTGYVARAREWGLLEPKLVNHHYQLTNLGQEQAEPWESTS